MDRETLIQFRSQGIPFHAYMGMETVKIEDGYAEVVYTVRAEHQNAYGAVHGGCLYTLADVVSGSAVASYGYQAVTASGEYHYFAPAIHTKTLRGIARTIKKGKRLMVTEVEILTDNGNLAGKGLFTHSIVESKIRI